MRRDQWFFLILMTALLARGLFFSIVAHPEVWTGSLDLPGYDDPVQDATDETDYHLLALHLADSGQLKLSHDGPPTATRAPGTVLPLALLYRAFGPQPILGVAFVVACSLLIVPLVGALARHSGGSLKTERLAMVLSAVTPTLVFVGSGIWSDTPAVLAGLLSLVLLLEARARGYALSWVALAALSLGMAYLNRPSAVLAAVFVVPILWIDSSRPAPGLRTSFGRSLRITALFILIVALPIVGWGLWNRATLGTFFIGNTTATATLLQANNPVTAGLRPPALAIHKGFDLYREAEEGRYLGSWVPLRYVALSDPWTDRSWPELEAEGWLRAQVADFIRDHPKAFLRLLAFKAWRIATAEPTAPSVLAEGPTKRRLKRLVTFAERWFFLALGGLGLVLLWRRRRFEALCILLYAVAGVAPALLAYPNARILLPMTTALIVPTAVAIEWLWKTWGPTDRRGKSPTNRRTKSPKDRSARRKPPKPAQRS